MADPEGGGALIGRTLSDRIRDHSPSSGSGSFDDGARPLLSRGQKKVQQILQLLTLVAEDPVDDHRIQAIVGMRNTIAESYEGPL